MDPYLDPDAWVLVNLYGIRDRDELREVEDDVAGAAMATLSESDLPAEYGWPLLSEIHRLLFQHVYAWAGSARTVGIAKDESSRFAPPELIGQELEALELLLADFPSSPTERSCSCSSRRRTGSSTTSTPSGKATDALSERSGSSSVESTATPSDGTGSRRTRTTSHHARQIEATCIPWSRCRSRPHASRGLDARPHPRRRGLSPAG